VKKERENLTVIPGLQLGTLVPCMDIIQGLSSAHEPGYSVEKLIHFMSQVMSTTIREKNKE
jgi:hypothetical protein